MVRSRWAVIPVNSSSHSVFGKAELLSTKVAVVIPSYNERENLAKLLPAVLAEISSTSMNGVVVVVDDNSPDMTADLVTETQKKYQNLLLFKRPLKSGLGSAYIDAFRRLTSDPQYSVFIQMDADLSHPPSTIKDLVSLVVDGQDVVIASRYVKEGGSTGWSWLRRVLSLGFNLLVRLVAGVGVHDSTSGYRALSRRAVVLLINHPLRSGGFAYQIESLTVFLRGRMSISEVPFLFRRRSQGQSKISILEIPSLLKVLLHMVVATRFCLR